MQLCTGGHNLAIRGPSECNNVSLNMLQRYYDFDWSFTYPPHVARVFHYIGKNINLFGLLFSYQLFNIEIVKLNTN